MTLAESPAETTPEIPRIVSVDDHVVEPPHLWQTWLPEKYRDRGPKVERRGIGTMRHIGGGTYEQTYDPTGPQGDCWIFEDLVYINKRHVAAVGFDRDDIRLWIDNSGTLSIVEKASPSNIVQLYLTSGAYQIEHLAAVMGGVIHVLGADEHARLLLELAVCRKRHPEGAKVVRGIEAIGHAVLLAARPVPRA